MMVFLSILFACAAQDDTTNRQGEPEPGDGGVGGGDAGSGGDGGDGGTGADSGGDGGGATGPCPTDMVEVQGAFCVDRAEAALEERQGDAWVAASPYATIDGREVRAVVAWGTAPQAYISGDEADAACAAAGKRLCSSDEWKLACEGPAGWTWPYGDTYQEGACNDDYQGGHPVTDYYGTSTGVWDTDSMNDPGINQQDGTVADGGDYSGCESAWGAFDLHGNLHEWVDDSDGTFRGGFYADASINGAGCSYSTTAHDRGYHDYSTGFRCCAETDAR